jgi:hypothetical protein
MQAVNKNLVNIIILVLLVIVALQRCEPTGPSEQPTIVRDTVLVVKESLTVTKPQLVETI